MSNTLLNGLDRTNNKVLPLDVSAAGKLQVQMSGGGDATAALQTAGNSTLTSIDGKISACNTGAVVVSSGTIAVSAVSGTTAVSATSLPLPTGASTAVNQAAHEAKLDDIIVEVKGDKTVTNIESSKLITNGSLSSEIDVGNHKNIVIYGESDMQGSLAVGYLHTSGGTAYYDSNKLVMANDPAGGTDYSFAISLPNVSNRYLVLKNVSGSSMTISMWASVSN